MLPFRAILTTLADSHDVVRGAIFCDEQGERVDAVARKGVALDEIELVGAAYAAVARAMPGTVCMRTVQGDACVWLAKVEEGYFLLVTCDAGTQGSLSTDIPRAVAALAAHM